MIVFIVIVIILISYCRRLDLADLRTTQCDIVDIRLSPRLYRRRRVQSHQVYLLLRGYRLNRACIGIFSATRHLSETSLRESR